MSPEEVLMAELIRRPHWKVCATVAALSGGCHRRGHSQEGRTEEQGELIDVHAILYVEGQPEGHRDRQEARLQQVGTTARRQIEQLLGTQGVPHDLQVKVAKNWQQDPKLLGRLGFSSVRCAGLSRYAQDRSSDAAVSGIGRSCCASTSSVRPTASSPC